jgi:hypothetical protein
MNPVPLQLLASADRLHCLLDTLRLPWDSVSCFRDWFSPLRPIGGTFEGDFDRIAHYALFPGFPDSEPLVTAMKNWFEELKRQVRKDNPAGVVQSAHCLQLIVDLIYHSACNQELASLLKPENCLYPLRGLFQAFGREELFTQPVPAVVAALEEYKVSHCR